MKNIDLHVKMSVNRLVMERERERERYLDKDRVFF